MEPLNFKFTFLSNTYKLCSNITIRSFKALLFPNYRYSKQSSLVHGLSYPTPFAGGAVRTTLATSASLLLQWFWGSFFEFAMGFVTPKLPLPLYLPTSLRSPLSAAGCQQVFPFHCADSNANSPHDFSSFSHYCSNSLSISFQISLSSMVYYSFYCSFKRY
jgi:hypothetical protein